jgi:hypothetical protein
MTTWTFLADYRQFKAGDVITGYREDLQMGTFVDENVVTSVDGNEVLIPLRFLQENSSAVRANYWILVILTVLLAAFIIRKLAK